MAENFSSSHWVFSEDKSNSLCSMYFGVSCAFFAIRVLSRPVKQDENWIHLCDKMLQGSAQLLGLLVWRIQRGAENGGQPELLLKLATAEKQIEELKKIRREDARANEKVVSIFASQEQSWLIERKKLGQHIGALFNQLKLLEKKTELTISEMNEKLKETELLVESKDQILKEEEHKRMELEEKLTNAENIEQELRETAKREAQEYSADLWKHKTAFLELVSNQRQLEAEMGRALRQLETKRQELNSVLGKKEESVLLAQKLSVEVVKMQKDLEQKDNILSAMLRKSKLDTAEKQMLLKEVKLSKAKRKQAELESERWRMVYDSRREKNSLRSMFSHQSSSRADNLSVAKGASASQIEKGRSQPADYVIEREDPESKDLEDFSSISGHRSPKGNGELAADVKRIEGWVSSEAEKYSFAMEKRHHLEIDAFTEQLRLKDEKLEAFHWRMLSMEFESKRLQSHMEGLDKDVSHLRHKNMKLEALLLEKQEELNALKEQFALQIKSLICQKTNSNSSLHDPALAHGGIWSKVKIVKSKPIEKDAETKTNLINLTEEKGTDEGEEDNNNHCKNVSLVIQSPEREIEEEKDVPDDDSIREVSGNPLQVEIAGKLTSPSQMLIKTTNSQWRMDVHALGVSYKIKRLKQQLLMLERLTGKQESGEDTETNSNAKNETKGPNHDDAQNGIKGCLLLTSFLNKQVSRYQSLQEKTDELCKRMNENDVDTSQGDGSSARTKGETKTLEHFLEETFQLQRYMVATGQKLMEVQSRIVSEFVEVSDELTKSASFDTKRFADSIKTLFQEVQRGLEVRIARIIGDLEGTLAREGMLRIRRQ